MDIFSFFRRREQPVSEKFVDPDPVIISEPPTRVVSVNNKGSDSRSMLYMAHCFAKAVLADREAGLEEPDFDQTLGIARVNAARMMAEQYPSKEGRESQQQALCGLFINQAMGRTGKGRMFELFNAGNKELQRVADETFAALPAAATVDR